MATAAQETRLVDLRQNQAEIALAKVTGGKVGGDAQEAREKVAEAQTALVEKVELDQ